MPVAVVDAREQAEPGMEAGYRGSGAGEHAPRTLEVTPSHQRVEELKRRRRQEQVNKARLMLEFVGQDERQELTATFPELLQPEPSDRRVSMDGPEPKARIFVGPDVVRESSRRCLPPGLGYSSSSREGSQGHPGLLLYSPFLGASRDASFFLGLLHFCFQEGI